MTHVRGNRVKKNKIGTLEICFDYVLDLSKTNLSESDFFKGKIYQYVQNQLKNK